MTIQTIDQFGRPVTEDRAKPVRNWDLSTGMPIVGLRDEEYQPPWKRDLLHSHNCYEIGFCLSGAGQVQISERVYPFSSSTVIAVPPGMRHCQINDGSEHIRWRYLMFNGDLLIRETPERLREDLKKILGKMAQGIYCPAELCDVRLAGQMDRLFRLYHAEKQLNGTEADALLRLIIFSVSRAEDYKARFPRTDLEMIGASAVQPALKRIAGDYQNEIRIADLADACRMSESYFRRVFTETMQMSPIEYINRFRVNRAIYLLRTTDEPVFAIAEQTGFFSVATFNRNFKRYTGMTAQSWRETEDVRRK